MIILRKKEISTKADHRVALKSKNNEKHGISKGGYGLAVDLGTTSVCAQLYNMENGKCLGTMSQMNAQCAYGSDVVMRLMHCAQGKEEKLHRLIVNQIDEMAELLTRQQAAAENKKRIESIVVVGNTTMCHIFLNKNTDGLTGAPFYPAYEENYCCTGKETGFSFLKHTQVTVLSGIASHVGADTMAVILEQNLASENKRQLVVDIGTNAEIIFNNNKKLSVCSTAAGPAFEGMGITFGMRGVSGAVSGFKIAPHAKNLLLEVLADKGQEPEPVGICGSGLVDIVAQLVKHNIILPDGYLLSKEEAVEKGVPSFLCEQLRTVEQEHQFVLFQNGQDEIYLTQQDIRNFQLAKASVQAGMKVLLLKMNEKLENVDELVLTGVFGNHLPEKSAVFVGLLPDHKAIRTVENAALGGAVKALFSENVCDEAQKLVPEIIHVELANTNNFEKQYIQAMDLKPW